LTQPLSQTAVFVCKSESFRRWVDRQCGLLDRTTDVNAAAEFIKRECDVISRRELDNNPEKACAFQMLLSKYRRESLQWGLLPDDFIDQKRACV